MVKGKMLKIPMRPIKNILNFLNVLITKLFGLLVRSCHKTNFCCDIRQPEKLDKYFCQSNTEGPPFISYYCYLGKLPSIMEN